MERLELITLICERIQEAEMATLEEILWYLDPNCEE